MIRTAIWQRILSVSLTSCLAVTSFSATTIIKSARLLDPHSGNVLSPAAVLIEDNKIKEVGPAAQIQAHAGGSATVIDLGGAALLPGLIDSHTHLFIDPIAPAEV